MRRALLAALLVGAPMSLEARDIAVEARYLARIATPPGAVFDALFVAEGQGSDAPGDGTAATVAVARLLDAGNPPYGVTLTVPEDAGPGTIHARLRVPGGAPFFHGTAKADGGAVSVVMRPHHPANTPLHGTRWRLLSLDGAAVGVLAGERDLPWIAFLPEGRIAGTGGCNRISAGYVAGPGDAIAFEPGISTMMACEDAVMARERAIFDALALTGALLITGDTMTLSARGDKDPLAVWVADPR